MAKRNKRNAAKKHQQAARVPKVNRNYKDTVFRMLFSERKNLLSLYNAVNGTNYQNPDDLEIVTLENAIYMGMKNDLAFIINTNLFLYEHQSTYNPNIPLRDFFYISSEYEKMVSHKSLYSSALQKIPAPEFVVFYNGTRKTADVQKHRLSEAFLNLSGEPSLELIVKVLNVNEGHNQSLMNQCQILKEYTQYVAKVRKYQEELPLDQAVEKAVTDCIDQEILKDFLLNNKAEVIRMSIFEYDKEKEEKKLRQAEYEAGVQEGILQMSERLGLTSEQTIQQLSEGLKITTEEAEQIYKDFTENK